MRTLLLTLLALALIPAVAAAGPNDPSIHWPLDTATSTSTPDISANHYDGTLNHAATALSDGRFDGALRLGGASGTRIERTLGSDLKLQTFTTVNWIRANGYPGDGMIASIDTGGGCPSPRTYLRYANSGGELSVQAADLRQYIPSAEIYDGKWHMLAVVSQDAQAHIFLDGSEMPRDEGTGQPGDYGFGSNVVLTLGGSHCGGPTSTVDFDEFSMYPRALTAAELGFMGRSRFSEPPELPVPLNDPGWSGLIDQWHLEGKNHFNVTHDTGPGYYDQGQFLANAPFTTGRFGNGLSIPAATANQGVLAPPVTPAAVTAMAWVRSNGSPGANKVIVGSGGSFGCGDIPWVIDTGPSGGLRWSVNATDSFGNTVRGVELSSPGSVWDNSWHLVIGSYDGSHLKMWFDSTKITDLAYNDAAPINYTVASTPRVATFSIGRYAYDSCGRSFVGGQIDEVRVYNRGLFDDEVQWIQQSSTTPHDLPDPQRAPEPAPVGFDKPEVSGNPITSGAGRITCSTGTWTGHPTSFTYTWERGARNATTDNDASWVAIPGATGNGYTPTSADDNARVRCHVYATDLAGKMGDNVSVGIRTDPGVPAVVAAPSVVGVVAAGKVVRCDPGQWTNFPSFSYQWLRDGQPIAGATSSEYTVKRSYLENDRELDDPNGDGNHQVGCRMTAANDVGAAAPSDSATFLGLDGVPVNYNSPAIREEPGATQFLGRKLTCDEGRWLSDSAALGEPGTGYEYRWDRNGQPIGSANGKRYVVQAEDLGTTLRCDVKATNHLGQSDFALSNAYEVPLPQRTVEGGEFKAVFRQNRYDPINMMVLGQSYANVLGKVILTQLQRAVNAEIASCKTMKNVPAAPTAAKPPKFPITADVRCAILLKDPGGYTVSTSGVKWNRGQFCQPNTADIGGICNDMNFKLPPLDPGAKASFDADLQAQLEAATPLAVVWDIDGDGKTDITCPGTAPVVRGLFDPGTYAARGVVVYPDSATTGRLASASLHVSFPKSTDTKPAKLRTPTQPIWCRTSIVPPPDPETGPCTGHGAIGNVQLEGNLCPINLRATPDAAFDDLDPQVAAVLQASAEAVTKAEHDAEDPAKQRRSTKLLAKPVAPGIATDPLKPATFLPPVLQKPASYETISAYNAASSLLAFDVIKGSGDDRLIKATDVDHSPGDVLGKFNFDKAMFATDQIYSVVGDLKVNGVTVEPQGSKPLPTLIVPSDAGEAIPSVADVKKMTINAKNVVQKMAVQKIKDGVKQGLSEIPLSPPDELNQLIKDVPNAPDQILKDKINLDALGDKLNLGPFKLAGTSADIKLQANGTAIIHAQAELPIIVGSDGKGLRTDVTLLGDENGNIKLQGVSLSQREGSTAFMFGLQLTGLLLSYDPEGGLTVKGQITFPASGGQGINIESFQLDSDGRFKSLDVDYLTGIGQGIPIGPGVFLTKLGGGLYNDDKAHYTAVRAGGAVSAIAPSAGGGCPTVGTSGDLNIQFRPAFEGHVHGDVNVVCIPIGGMNLDVYPERGDLHLDMHWGLDLYLVSFGAQLVGNVHVDPNMWQIEYGMRVGFPFLKNKLTGTPHASALGVLSNKGAAICADVLGFDVGVGVHFPGGRPPITYPEFIANLRPFFSGCDRSEFASFPLTVSQAGGEKKIKLDGSYVTLAIDGAGGAPKVQLKSPSGKVYDFSKTENADIIDDTMGAVLADEARTAVILKKPEKGAWTVIPVAGSPPIVRISHASKLPKPKVTGKLTGKGQNKTLTYNVRPLKGQAVNFVEESKGGHRIVKTVKTGGKGKVNYVVAESAGSKRELTAEVVQNDMPRDNIVIATYRASNPKVGKPKVKIKRVGSKAVVTWSSAALATRYYVTVTDAKGARYSLMPKGKKRTVTIKRVGKKDKVLVGVRGVSAGGRQGPTGKATLTPPKKKRR